MKVLRISLFTTIERNQALAKAKQTISGGDGWIVDYALFSSLAATVNFELAIKNCAPFSDQLRDIGFSVGVEGDVPDGDNADIRESLSLKFLHDAPI